MIFLPSDFIQYFKLVNGMQSLYPNYNDNEGFLFYPLQKLVTVQKEFKGLQNQYSNMIIFAEYMHKSWWYVIDILKDDTYEIGIMPNMSIYKPITTSLNEFLRLYIDDSEKLYNV